MMSQPQPNNYELHLGQRIPRATIVHHIESDGSLYASHGRRVWRISQSDRVSLGRFPSSYPRDYFGWSRLSQRAARADKCNLLLNRERKLIGVRGGTVFAIEDGHMNPLFQVQGDSALHGGLVEDLEGWVYIGEYFMNPDRGPVRIWRLSPDLKHWEVAIEFGPGVTRHVHGVFADPFDHGVLWATLGDFGDECFFARTEDRFQTHERIGSGGQLWRCVHPFFTPTHVCWITDSNLEPNFACRFDRNSHDLETGQSIPCSGWYGFQDTLGNCVCGTTVERGPGITSKYSSIYVSNDGFQWNEAGRFRKDVYRPMKIFKYGVVGFPSGAMSLDRFVISGEGLSGMDGRSYYASIRAARAKA